MPNVRSTGLASPEMRWDKAVDQSRSRGYKLDRIMMRLDPKVSEGKLAKTRDLFKSYCDSRMESLGKDLGLSEAGMEKLSRKCAASVKAIMSETFEKPGQHGVSQKQFKELVKTANARAQQALISLTEGFGSPDARPQVMPFKDSSGNMRITVIKPAPSIETLVLRGGGAKGVGNGAALVEMDKAGMLKGLKSVVGTSAGALTALALASGMSAEAFKAFADATDMGALKGSPSNLKSTYPMLKFSTVGFDAGTALQKMDEVSSNGVRSQLERKWGDVEMALQNGDITPENVERLEQLLQPPALTGSREGKMVTFGDLKLMAKLFPEFKELTLTGMNRTDSELSYFSADTTPDMPVAVAGRISMSIPGFFSSISYELNKEQGSKTWVDGGVGSNMPSGVVTDPLTSLVDAAKADLDRAVKGGDAAGIASASARLEVATRDLGEKRSRTLLMNFDEGGTAYDKMHKPKSESSWRGPLDWLKGAIAGDTRYLFNQNRDNRNIRDAGPNVMVVHHGNIDTLNMGAGARRKDAAALEAQMRMLQQVAMRQNQATHDVFNSPAQAASSLSSLERKQVIAAGEPTLSQYEKADRSTEDALSLFRQADDFYSECRNREGVGV